MNLWPNQVLLPFRTIVPVSLESIGAEITSLSTQYVSATWVAANRAIFVPFFLQVPISVAKLFIANGSAGIPNDNFDIGIYSGELGGTATRITSTGSTAQSGTDTRQDVSVSATLIGPGEFFLAVAMNGTTGTVYRAATNIQTLRRSGMRQMASAFPLPATATLAALATAYLPMFGLSQ